MHTGSHAIIIATTYVSGRYECKECLDVLHTENDMRPLSVDGSFYE